MHQNQTIPRILSNAVNTLNLRRHHSLPSSDGDDLAVIPTPRPLSCTVSSSHPIPSHLAYPTSTVKYDIPSLPFPRCGAAPRHRSSVNNERSDPGWARAMEQTPDSMIREKRRKGKAREGKAAKRRIASHRILGDETSGSRINE